MKPKYSWLKQAALLISLLVASSGAAAFPEIPFCPLGGPPGWLNRLTDDDDHRYYPPPLYPPPVFAPYWNVPNTYPYVPQYPAYPGYFVR